MLSRGQFLRTISTGIVTIHPSMNILSEIFATPVQKLENIFSYSFEFIRPDDFLNLNFYFINVTRSKQLLIKGGQGDGYMIVRVPQMHVPEHLLTDCQYYIDGKAIPGKPSFYDHGATVPSFSSSYSFLAFRMNFCPAEAPGEACEYDALESSSENLLNWNLHTILTEADLKVVGASLPLEIEHKTSKPSVYPIVTPDGTPMPSTAGANIPVSFFEFPYKFYISMVAVPSPKDRYCFQHENRMKRFTIKNHRAFREITELYNNELFLVVDKTHEFLHPSFRIIGYAKDYGGDADQSKNESQGIRIDNPQYSHINPGDPDFAASNKCDSCAKQLRTGGLLPYGSNKLDGIYRPGITNVGNGLNHRSILAKLSNKDKDKTDRDLHTSHFAITAWGGYSFMHYYNLNDQLDDTPNKPNKSIISFTERIVLGRDEFIEVITEGYDQFGIKCYYIQIGEVTFSGGNHYIRYYVIIKYPNQSVANYVIDGDPSKDYQRSGVIDEPLPPGSTEKPYVTRKIPFQKIAPVTRQTKKLDPARDIQPITQMPPGSTDCAAASMPGGLLIFYNGQPYDMEYSGIDRNGNTIKIVKPLLFIDALAWNDLNNLALTNKLINDGWGQLSEVEQKKVDHPVLGRLVKDWIPLFRKARTFNQKIGMVDLTGRYLNSLNDPDLKSNLPPSNVKVNEVETEYIDFYSNLSSELKDEKLPCLPAMKEAAVYLPHLQGLVSRNVKVKITYGNSFLKNKFCPSKNAAQVFANLTDDTIKNIKSQLADPINLKALGGLVTPDIPIQSLSTRIQGITLTENTAIKKIGDTIDGINPSQIFRGSVPEFFKAINIIKVLSDIVPLVETPTFSVVQQLDQDIEQTDPAVQGILSTINSIKDQARNEIKNYQDQISVYQQRLANLAAGKEQAEFQRLQKVLTEQAYVKRIQDRLDDAASFTNNEIAFIKAQFQDYTKTVESSIEQLSGTVFTKYLTAAMDLNQVIAEAKAQFTAYANKAVDDFRAMQANFFNKIDSLMASDQGIVDPVTLLVIDYNHNRFKSELLSSLRPVIDYRSTFTGPGKYKDIFGGAASLQGILDNYLGYAENLVLVELLRDLNDKANPPKIAPKNLENIYTVLTGFLSKAEEELNQLKSTLNADPTNLNNLKSLVPGLQKQIQLLRPYYSERAGQLVTESSQLVRKIKSDKYEDEYEKTKDLIYEIAKKAQLVKFPMWGFLDPKNLKQSYDEIEKIYLEITKAGDSISKILVDDVDNIKAEIRHLQDLIQAAEKKLADGLNGLLETANDQLNKDYNDLLTTVEANRAALQERINALQRFILYVNNGGTISRTYSWSTTHFRDADFGIIQFHTHSNPQTQLSINNEAVIKLDYSKFPPSIKSLTFSNRSVLKNFSIVFLQILDVSFNYIQFFDSTGGQQKFDIKIDNVTFAGSLSFLQALQGLLSTVDKGIKINVKPRQVSLSYTLAVPDIPALPGTFGFKNLNFSFGTILPFDGNPLQCSFAIASAANKFRLVLGFYQGGGFFKIVAEPKNGVKSVEIAVEMGVYVGIQILALTGYVQISAGMYYGRFGSRVIISGYISAEGHADLLGLGVTVSLYMGFTSDGNSCTGECSVRYSIHFGFFGIDFEEGYRKTISGSDSGSDDRDATNKLQEADIAMEWPAGHGPYAGVPLKIKDEERESVFEEYWQSFF